MNDCLNAGKSLFLYPLAGCHAGDGFEGPEEGGFVGKARSQGHIRQFLARVLPHELYGMVDAIAVDKLREGKALLLVDAVGEV